jgi:hypothetical protein
MNHQLIDNWLQDPAGMTAEQTSELQAHLAVCNDCKRIYIGWQAAHNLITHATVVTAPAGFTDRFQSSLSERRRFAHRLQARKFGLALIGAILLISIFLLVQFFASHPAVEVLSQGIQFLTIAPQRVVELRYIVAFWLGQIPALYLVVAGFILLSWTMLLPASWVMALRRSKHQGVTQS